MPFDVRGARAAGYSDREIMDFMQQPLDLRPTWNRPLVHQDDPVSRDAALQKAAQLGLEVALPLGLAGLGGPAAMGVRALGPALTQSILGPLSHPDPRVLQGEMSPKPGGKATGRTLTDLISAPQLLDDAGNPLRVYHGTAASFDKFDPVYSTAEPGFFFTDNPSVASQFAASKTPGMGYGAGANVRPAHLQMKDPLIVDMEGKAKYQGFDSLIRRAKAQGKDGLIVKNVDDAPGYYDPFGGIPNDVYVAFNPEQVLPAFGKKK